MKKILILFVLILFYIIGFGQNGVEVTTGFDVKAKTLLDSRCEIATLSDTTTILEVKGLLIYVTDIDKYYYYSDKWNELTTGGTSSQWSDTTNGIYYPNGTIQIDSGLVIPTDVAGESFSITPSDRLDSIIIHSDVPVRYEYPNMTSMTEDDWTGTNSINGDWQFTSDVEIQDLTIANDLFVNGSYQGTPAQYMWTIDSIQDVDSILMYGDLTGYFTAGDTAVFGDAITSGNLIKRKLASITLLNDTTYLVLQDTIPDVVTYLYILPDNYVTLRFSDDVTIDGNINSNGYFNTSNEVILKNGWYDILKSPGYSSVILGILNDGDYSSSRNITILGNSNLRDDNIEYSLNTILGITNGFTGYHSSTGSGNEFINNTIMGMSNFRSITTFGKADSNIVIGNRNAADDDFDINNNIIIGSNNIGIANANANVFIGNYIYSGSSVSTIDSTLIIGIRGTTTGEITKYNALIAGKFSVSDPTVTINGDLTVDNEISIDTEDLTFGGDITFEGNAIIKDTISTDFLCTDDSTEIKVCGDLNITGNLLGSLVTKSYPFTSNGVASGTYYNAGYYDASSTEAVLTIGGTASVNYGEPNVSYAAHAFVVAKEAGGRDLVLTVYGTSITDAGVRTTSDSEIIVADADVATTDAYYETTKKWIGKIEFALTGASDSFSFNYGFCKYEDFGNTDFTLVGYESVGSGGANDSNFDIIVYHHSSSDWIYAASGFEPGGTEILSFQDINGTESEISNEHPFACKRVGLSIDIEGSASEGLVIKIITGQNGTVQSMYTHLGVKFK